MVKIYQIDTSIKLDAVRAASLTLQCPICAASPQHYCRQEVKQYGKFSLAGPELVHVKRVLEALSDRIVEYFIDGNGKLNWRSK